MSSNLSFIPLFLMHCQSTVRPRIREIRNSTIKIKNNTFAIPAAPAAIPPKPNTPAMIAIMRKITVHRNIIINF